MKIICTEKEKFSLCTALAQSEYCFLLACHICALEDCSNKRCRHCIENSIEWEVKE